MYLEKYTVFYGKTENCFKLILVLSYKK